MIKAMTCAAAMLASAETGQGYRTGFDPSRLKGPIHGTPNAVMVLGSPHLAQLSNAFRPEQAAPLMARLAAWRPQLIAIEVVSGAQCDQLRRYPARYRDAIASYCWDPAPARAATGLDVAAATVEADRLLAGWPATPGATQRRRLAAVMLASGDRFSALVQWLRLPEAERHAGEGLDAGLVALLDKLKARRGEDTVLAVALAVRLGLERIVLMDDHSADGASSNDPAADAAMMRMWDNPIGRQRKAADDRLQAALGTPNGLLAMYRAYNAPGYWRLVYGSDFGAALAEPSPQGIGRAYLTYWEVRNLRMAANIREAIGRNTGTRALVIVGASHKQYLEAYLQQMHDVRLVGTDTVLR